MKKQKIPRNKKLTISGQFKEAKSYVKESSKYIYASILIFLASAVVGFIFQQQLTFIEEIIKDLIERTADLNTQEIMAFILQNNIQSSLFSILLGSFMGIFPLISSVGNGLILGYVMARTAQVASFTIWWRLLPHGIFEFPAIFLSFGIGLKFGIETLLDNIKHYWKNEPSVVILSIIFPILLPLIAIANPKLKKSFLARFYNSVNAFLMIIIPLLILAAIIEGFLIGLTS